jgi:hypothetical protein
MKLEGFISSGNVTVDQNFEFVESIGAKLGLFQPALLAVGYQ